MDDPTTNPTGDTGMGNPAPAPTMPGTEEPHTDTPVSEAPAEMPGGDNQAPAPMPGSEPAAPVEAPATPDSTGGDNTGGQPQM